MKKKYLKTCISVLAMLMKKNDSFCDGAGIGLYQCSG